VIATGALAFANARVRAMKSRLLGREIAGRFAAGLATMRDERLDPARGFQELIGWYGIVLRTYPRRTALLLALWRRFEIENVKLAWRAIVNGAIPSRWTTRSIELDPLATIARAKCVDSRTLAALVENLQTTPYATVAAEMWRAHADDLAAAELGFDRWASRAIADAAARLPAADRTAADLALPIVRERDFNLARRMNAVPLSASIALPREWRRRAPPAHDHDRWAVWLRAERRRLCRRAFLESPFCLAPAVALLLLTAAAHASPGPGRARARRHDADARSPAGDGADRRCQVRDWRARSAGSRCARNHRHRAM
jgi:hypothetical protein